MTETSLLDSARSAPIIAKIRQLGLKVALDDFGTGYSNLAILNSIQVDILKIDKRFTQKLSDASGKEVIASIIRLAQSLHLEIVAEGVETEEQASYLIDAGVHYAQGWLFGKPDTVDKLPNYESVFLPDS